jgi:hypothetical protein
MQSEVRLATVIRIEVVERETNFTAKSPDLPGLFVSAKTAVRLLEAMPRWIEKHMNAMGERVIAARAYGDTPGYATYVVVPVGVAEAALNRISEIA